jgi:Uma2 family endonuclease
MSTIVKLGPADHGRPLSLEEFEHGAFEDGYQYELIDGRLYVSPQPNAPMGFLERWLFLKLHDYSRERPEVVNYVHPKARVFVPDRPGVTTPEPDVTLYHDFPLDLDLRDMRWQDVSPFLVCEVVSEDDPRKDLVRNVELYLEVPSIREYWVVDGRPDPNHPTLTVYRRYGRRWRRPLVVAPGETCTTPLLPGFALVVDPRS